MTHKDTPARHIVLWLAVILLTPLAGISIHRGLANAIGATNSGGSIDLHSYWGPGRALISGADPYAASLSGDLTPYGVGTLPEESGLPNNPANSPPNVAATLTFGNS